MSKHVAETCMTLARSAKWSRAHFDPRLSRPLYLYLRVLFPTRTFLCFYRFRDVYQPLLDYNEFIPDQDDSRVLDGPLIT